MFGKTSSGVVVSVFSSKQILKNFTKIDKKCSNINSSQLRLTINGST